MVSFDDAAYHTVSFPLTPHTIPLQSGSPIHESRVLRQVTVGLCQRISMPTVSTGQPATNHPNSNQVVVFADMLGFAALTEANPIDIRMLRTRSRPFSLTLDDILDGRKNPLTEAFMSFHYSLKWAIMTAEMKHALTAVTFSDSVFIATTHPFEAATVAVDLAHSLLSQKVAVRMGIAFGSFAALAFRSDVSADGEDHAAEFLGTAVVRDCEAEKCGIKGMRILLHRSIEPLFADSAHNPPSPPTGSRTIRPLECPDAERAKTSSVRYELDYWDLAPTKERRAWHALQDMWAEVSDPFTEHYQGHCRSHKSNAGGARGRPGHQNAPSYSAALPQMTGYPSV